MYLKKSGYFLMKIRKLISKKNFSIVTEQVKNNME
jgi:hypothetical protein